MEIWWNADMTKRQAFWKGEGIFSPDSLEKTLYFPSGDDIIYFQE